MTKLFLFVTLVYIF